MASDSSCNDINDCRKLFDIIWGCVVTIFACTWISVHPNVPPPHFGPISIVLRRFSLMVIAVIAPEMMIFFALRQFIVARKYSKEYNLSLTHGFFISMGGFVTRQGHHPITLRHQLTKEILREIKATKVHDIEDKSKGDAVSKGLALLQTSWFLLQIFTRAIQHLPITVLEIATVGFAILNLLVYGLWWCKPLDVQRPIMIGPGPEVETPATFRCQRFSPVVQIADLTSYDPDPEESISGPIQWAGYLKSERVGYTVYCVVTTTVACLFGAIHCFAWNFSFPTSTEQTMWRMSAAFVALYPFFFLLVSATDHILDDLDWQSLLKRFPFLRSCQLFLRCIYVFATIMCIGVPLYVVCRLILLTITFTILRSLPPDAYHDIDWTTYLPHMY